MQVIRQDGITSYELADEDFTTGERETKGKRNGVTFRKYTHSVKAADLEGGPLMDTPEGIRIVKKLTVVEETVDPEAVARKADAKKFRAFAAEIRRRAGLGGGKGKVAEGDKLSLSDLVYWIDGQRVVNGYKFENLPEETREKVHEIVVKLDEKEKARVVKVGSSQKELAAALGKLASENPGLTVAEIIAKLAGEAVAAVGVAAV